MLGVIGRNGAGKSTLLKILTRIAAPTSGRAEIRGRVGQPARGRDGVQPGADRARERLSQRRHPRHEATGDRVALRRHRRVLRGREVHRHTGEALLERHVRPPRVRGRGAPRARDPVRRRGARRWATRSSSVAVSVAWRSSPTPVGRSCSSRTRCRRSRSSATARSGSTAASSSGTADATDMIAEYLHQTRSRHGARVARGVRSGQRPHADPGDQGPSPRGDAARRCRRPATDRDRDRVRRPARRASPCSRSSR